jgi:hypothetical protein
MNDIREFVFEKNLWLIDTISSTFFALCMSALVQYGADSGQKHVKSILFAMLVGGSSYLITFLLSLSLRQKLPSVRSWVWMGIIGALVQIIVRALIAFPSMWGHLGSFSPSLYDVIVDLVSIILIGLAFNWLLWAILGCGFIFTVRVFAYFFQDSNQRMS